MEHIPVITKIKQIHDRIPDVSFIYDDWSRLNERADNLEKPCETNKRSDIFETLLTEQFPLMFVLLRASGTFNRRNGNLRDYQNLTIGFVTPAEMDFDGLENDGRIEWMKAISKRFFQLYDKSGMFDPLPEDIPYNDVYNLFDANVTGIYFDIQARETGGVCQLPLDVFPDAIDPTQWYRDCSVWPPIVVNRGNEPDPPEPPDDPGILETWLTEHDYEHQILHFYDLFVKSEERNQVATNWTDYSEVREGYIRPIFIRPINPVQLGALNYQAYINYIGGNILTRGTTNMDSWYRNNTNMRRFDVYDFPDTTSAINTFIRCTSLYEAYLIMPNCINVSGCFGACTEISNVRIDTSPVCNFVGTFRGCRNIRNITINSGGNVKITSDNWTDFVNGASRLISIDAIIDISDATGFTRSFDGCTSLEIIHLRGLSRGGLNLSQCLNLRVSSIVELFNYANPVTGVQYLTIGATNLSKLTNDQIAIITNKGYRLN